MQSEVRYLETAELRFAEGNGRTVVGRIPYNTPSSPLASASGAFVETISPGAFSDALTPTADVRFLWNHDTSEVLGRTKSGTLTLNSDEAGLTFQCSLPDTTKARDVAELLRRGDVSGVSFGFRNAKADWTRDQTSGQRLRTLRSVEMYEISLCSFPAYPDTTAALRSCPAELLSDCEGPSTHDGLLALTLELMK